MTPFLRQTRRRIKTICRAWPQSLTCSKSRQLQVLRAQTHLSAQFTRVTQWRLSNPLTPKKLSPFGQRLLQPLMKAEAPLWKTETQPLARSNPNMSARNSPSLTAQNSQRPRPLSLADAAWVAARTSNYLKALLISSAQRWAHHAQLWMQALCPMTGKSAKQVRPLRQTSISPLASLALSSILRV